MLVHVSGDDDHFKDLFTSSHKRRQSGKILVDSAPRGPGACKLVKATELHQRFLGCGRVLLRHLEYGSARDETGSNVQRLRGIFERGCHRFDPEHFVPVLVDHDLLSRLLITTGVTSSDLTYQSPPLISVPLGTKLRCLHGRHRLLAAQEHLKCLPTNDQWWGVKFFDSALSVVSQASLRQNANNALQYSDGDIYRYYRTYLQQGDEGGQARWQVLLSQTKDKNLMRIERSHHGSLVKSLDSLLPFSGLWSGLQLGAFNRILPLRCFEELCCYIERIRSLWASVIGSDVDSGALDVKTVKLLELQSPRDSVHDARRIRQWMDEQAIFPTIHDRDTRDRLLTRILECPRILTLRSFTEDTIYLQSCHTALQNLLPDRIAMGKTFRIAFYDRFSHHKKYFLANFVELCLRGMRYFSDLGELPCSHLRRDKGHPRPPRAQIVPGRVQELAFDAYRLGFRSDQISLIMETCPAPPTLDHPSPEPPELSCDWMETPIRARCNRPSQLSLDRDRKHLFLHTVFEASQPQPKQYITTFYVLRDIVRSFWGPSAPPYSHEEDRLQEVEAREYFEHRTANLSERSHQTSPDNPREPHNQAPHATDDTLEQDFDDLFPRAHRNDEEAQRIQAETGAAQDQAHRHELQRLQEQVQERDRKLKEMEAKLRELPPLDEFRRDAAEAQALSQIVEQRNAEIEELRRGQSQSTADVEELQRLRKLYEKYQKLEASLALKDQLIQSLEQKAQELDKIRRDAAQGEREIQSLQEQTQELRRAVTQGEQSLKETTDRLNELREQRARQWQLKSKANRVQAGVAEIDPGGLNNLETPEQATLSDPAKAQKRETMFPGPSYSQSGDAAEHDHGGQDDQAAARDESNGSVADQDEGSPPNESEDTNNPTILSDPAEARKRDTMFPGPLGSQSASGAIEHPTAVGATATAGTSPSHRKGDDVDRAARHPPTPPGIDRLGAATMPDPDHVRRTEAHSSASIPPPDLASNRQYTNSAQKRPSDGTVPHIPDPGPGMASDATTATDADRNARQVRKVRYELDPRYQHGTRKGLQQDRVYRRLLAFFEENVAMNERLVFVASNHPIEALVSANSRQKPAALWDKENNIRIDLQQLKLELMELFEKRSFAVSRQENPRSYLWAWNPDEVTKERFTEDVNRLRKANGRLAVALLKRPSGSKSGSEEQPVESRTVSTAELWDELCKRHMAEAMDTDAHFVLGVIIERHGVD